MSIKTYLAITIIIAVISIGVFFNFQIEEQRDSSSNTSEAEQPTITRYLSKNEINNLVEVQGVTSIFKIYGEEGDFVLDKNGKQAWYKFLFDLDPANTEIYNKVGVLNEPQNTIVIFPEFTLSAYIDPGFYTYYNGYCDISCLTTTIKSGTRPEASGNAVQILSLLGYDFIKDSDVDKYPKFIEKYDKVILLHSEYVTREMFEAITNHPHVIYLYPNALYAEITANYEENTISLVRGHGHPDASIANGFDWEFENSQFEYNRNCSEMGFYKVDNGWMLNCWPEWEIYKNAKFLQTIKEL